MRKKIKADSKAVVESKVESEKDLKSKPVDLPVDSKLPKSTKAKTVHASGTRPYVDYVTARSRKSSKFALYGERKKVNFVLLSYSMGYRFTVCNYKMRICTILVDLSALQ